MEDKEESKTTQIPVSTGQVMDVTPAPAETVEESSPQSFVPSVEAAGDSEEASSVAVNEPASEEEHQENTSPSVQDTTEPPSNLPAPATPSGPKAGAPLLAIVLAIVVAIGLAAVTVYAYLQSQDKASKAPSTSQPANDTPAVTGEDVDQASSEVDGALNSSEETDFPETELNDQSLGL